MTQYEIEMMEKINSQLERLREGSQRIEKILELHTQLLKGDGQSTDGLLARVDRLESSEKNRQRWYIA